MKRVRLLFFPSLNLLQLLYSFSENFPTSSCITWARQRPCVPMFPRTISGISFIPKKVFDCPSTNTELLPRTHFDPDSLLKCAHVPMFLSIKKASFLVPYNLWDALIINLPQLLCSLEQGWQIGTFYSKF